jgi:hypothetical protein
MIRALPKDWSVAHYIVTVPWKNAINIAIYIVNHELLNVISDDKGWNTMDIAPACAKKDNWSFLETSKLHVVLKDLKQNRKYPAVFSWNFDTELRWYEPVKIWESTDIARNNLQRGVPRER